MSEPRRFVQPAVRRPLKIDILVHGRLHAFHLARALLARGHDVRVVTNYPAWAAARFGLPKACIRSLPAHGLAVRLHAKTLGRVGASLGLPVLHTWFGRWAARIARVDADLIYVFSSVAEEVIERFRGRAGPRIWVARGSSHIRTQHQLLAEEEARVGSRLEKPTAWTIAREEREYTLASRIVTLSTFSHGTFLERPGLAAKSILLMSAVDAQRFKAAPAVVADRLRRVAAGEPLRVLTVGAFSHRKGARDLLEVARTLTPGMSFRFVGDLPAETRALQAQCPDRIELVGRVPEFDLVGHYAWADIFVFPTIEDGFPAVVAQALSSGLVVITTPNGSGPDLVDSGSTGWLVPIRSPELIIDRLKRCDTDRAMLVAMLTECSGTVRTRDWSKMAEDLEDEFERQPLERQEAGTAQHGPS